MEVASLSIRTEDSHLPGWVFRRNQFFLTIKKIIKLQDQVMTLLLILRSAGEERKKYTPNRSLLHGAAVKPAVTQCSATEAEL